VFPEWSEKTGAGEKVYRLPRGKAMIVMFAGGGYSG
jgi:hypothetical protein